VSSPLLLTWTDDLDYQHPRRARATVPELTTGRVHPRVGSGHQSRKNQGVGSGRVDNFVYTTGQVGSPTQRVGSGPEKSDPWSTLRYTRLYLGGGRVSSPVLSTPSGRRPAMCCQVRTARTARPARRRVALSDTATPTKYSHRRLKPPHRTRAGTRPSNFGDNGTKHIPVKDDTVTEN